MDWHPTNWKNTSVLLRYFSKGPQKMLLFLLKTSFAIAILCFISWQQFKLLLILHLKYLKLSTCSKDSSLIRMSIFLYFKQMLYLLHTHISNASSRFCSFRRSVQVSALYNTVLHTKHFTSLFLSSFQGSEKMLLFPLKLLLQLLSFALLLDNSSGCFWYCTLSIWSCPLVRRIHLYFAHLSSLVFFR